MDGSQLVTQEIKLDAGGSDTGEWTKTYRDMLGRIAKVVYSDASGAPGPTTTYTYNQLNEKNGMKKMGSHLNKRFR